MIRLLHLKELLLSLAVASVAGSVLLVGTNAIFTDEETSGGNSFANGQIDLSTSAKGAILSLEDMLPGDKVTAPLTVSNEGSGTLRYAVRSVTNEDALAAQLDLTIKAFVDDCLDVGFDDSGSVLYGPAPLGSLSGINVIGNPNTGPQAGDRTLTAGTGDELCFQVSLPLSTGDEFQTDATEATFTFSAEQTANNP